MRHRTILVTGATGHVGRHLVTELANAGAGVRALTRRPGEADLPEGVEVVGGDLADLDAVRAALDGVDAVFLLWPFMTAEAAPGVVDEIARRAGSVVYLSTFNVPDDPAGADDGSITGSHARLERLVAASGLEWAVIRAGGFATNTLGWASQIRAEGVVRWPYGEAARSLVHEADIAAVAARVLTDGVASGTKHVVTGPAVVTQAEQVRTIGEAIGRPLRYEEIPPQVARAQLLAEGWPPQAADGALSYWAEIVERPEPVTRTVEEVTGRPARTFREWAGDHADDFR